MQNLRSTKATWIYSFCKQEQVPRRHLRNEKTKSNSQWRLYRVLLVTKVNLDVVNTAKDEGDFLPLINNY